MPLNNSPVKVLGSIVVATMLAACSGQSTGVVPQGTTPESIAHAQSTQNMQNVQSAERSPGDDANCKSDGHMEVKPCIVVFELLDLKPVNVSVKAPKRDTVSESDDCASKGVASIGGGDTKYTVTPGLLPGTCTATFSGQKAGKGRHQKGAHATLTVTNYN